ncbi:MAG: hypothetical protein RSB55_07050, partial [Oscillospiraceae bacterium]
RAMITKRRKMGFRGLDYCYTDAQSGYATRPRLAELLRGVCASFLRETALTRVQMGWNEITALVLI